MPDKRALVPGAGVVMKVLPSLHAVRRPSSGAALLRLRPPCCSVPEISLCMRRAHNASMGKAKGNSDIVYYVLREVLSLEEGHLVIIE